MRLLALAFALIMFSIPAYAGVEGNASASEKEFGKTFLPLVKDFGINEYVFAAKTSPVSVLYEYLPQGQNLESWTDLSSVTIFKVGDKASQIMPRIVESMQAGQGGQKVKDTLSFGADKHKVSYTEYVIAAGPIREHSLSLIWEVLPGTIANLQIQKRNGDHSEETKKKFLDFAEKTANPQ